MMSGERTRAGEEALDNVNIRRVGPSLARFHSLNTFPLSRFKLLCCEALCADISKKMHGKTGCKFVRHLRQPAGTKRSKKVAPSQARMTHGRCKCLLSSAGKGFSLDPARRFP
jgi:hypothetical protein